MNTSFAGIDQDDGELGEALRPLRRMILRLAERCGLDLGDPAAIRCFLDGDFSRCCAPDWDRHSCQDLHAMITLLFRLEASNSEDIGFSGLHRLWHQHGEIMSREHAPESVTYSAAQ